MLLSPIIIFIVCYMVDQIALLAAPEPPKWIVRLVTWIVGLVLVLIVASGRV